MSPADQPQAIDWRRSDPPTLWLSLGLGSVLIHLLFFIGVSIVLTRTAKVQLEVEPITVEFVDPSAEMVQARAAAPSRTIAARPGAPSSSVPSATQAQPSTMRSQPSAVSPPIEQPFIPQPTQRRRLPVLLRRPQPQPSSRQPQPSSQPVSPIPNAANRSTQPQPYPRRSSFPQPSGLPEPRQTQLPSSLPQERLPGPLPNPSGSSGPQPSGLGPPAEGERISQGTQGDSIIVTVSNPRQPTIDVQTQAAQPIDQQKNVSLHYSSALAQQTIRLEATLTIDQAGLVLRVEKTTLLFASSGRAIEEATVNDLATQIFTQWRFKPAQNNSNGKPSTPPLSNLIIDAQVQLP